MATPFSDVYFLFLSKITDNELAGMEEEALELNMEKWLLSGISRFSTIGNRTRVQNFDRVLQLFNESLPYNEQEILALMMLIEYLKANTITGESLKEGLSSKDYSSYSPAKKIEALIKLKDTIEKDISAMISRLSYSLENFKEVNKK